MSALLFAAALTAISAGTSVMSETPSVACTILSEQELAGVMGAPPYRQTNWSDAGSPASCEFHAETGYLTVWISSEFSAGEAHRVFQVFNREGKGVPEGVIGGLGDEAIYADSVLTVRAGVHVIYLAGSALKQNPAIMGAMLLLQRLDRFPPPPQAFVFDQLQCLSRYFYGTWTRPARGGDIEITYNPNGSYELRRAGKRSASQGTWKGDPGQDADTCKLEERPAKGDASQTIVTVIGEDEVRFGTGEAAVTMKRRPFQ